MYDFTMTATSPRTKVFEEFESLDELPEGTARELILKLRSGTICSPETAQTELDMLIPLRYSSDAGKKLYAALQLKQSQTVL